MKYDKDKVIHSTKCDSSIHWIDESLLWKNMEIKHGSCSLGTENECHYSSNNIYIAL